MAANILIYGNDIGDTARNDLARAQIMDQRSRDAMGGMRQTAQFLQNKGLQQDALKIRERELDESRKLRESYDRENRLSREKIAQDQRQAQMANTILRAADAGLMGPDELEEASKKFDDRYASFLQGTAKTLRQNKADEYDILSSEAAKLNRALEERAAVKPGVAWDSWGYRTQNEAQAQTDALRDTPKWEQAAMDVIETADEDIRPFIRFNPATRMFEPAMQDPMMRRQQPQAPPPPSSPGPAQGYITDPMSNGIPEDVARSYPTYIGGDPTNSAVGLNPEPGYDVDPWQRQPSMAPQQSYAVDPMMIPRGGGRAPIMPPQAVPSGPPMPAAPIAPPPQAAAGRDYNAAAQALGLDDEAWAAVQQLVSSGVPPPLAIDRVVKAIAQRQVAAAPPPVAPAQAYNPFGAGY